MDNKAKIKLVIFGVALFVLINFILVPFINRQKAVVMVKNVFNFWIKGDAATGIRHFVDKEKFPPIYGLESYKIDKKKFKKEDGKLKGEFWITLNFNEGNILPSGKTWYCEIGRYGRNWQVSDFYILPDQ